MTTPTITSVSPAPMSEAVPLGDVNAVAAQVNAKFPTAAQVVDGSLVVDKNQLVEVARFLRDEPAIGCNFLEDLTSVDWPDRFEVVYHLYNLTRPEGPLRVKVRADKADPVVDSLVPVYEGANLMEREVYDMMGIKFTGHPNLKRSLLMEGVYGHPL